MRVEICATGAKVARKQRHALLDPKSTVTFRRVLWEQYLFSSTANWMA
jgi:hypothetical protein